MVKGRQGERVRLYVRRTILGYKREIESESSCTLAISYTWN
ncbi:60S ribosomal L35a-3 -like protein [Gossypium arboreum]|uniref:60S ribosomal L35a-3-like protein n=1 Tax=Gossypium arboreum TaxID=29729 RepID=A0A0B0MK97_GOSAR|nr:60S ribosomal L35a-3 -like protein [Gossypium arboreum]